MTVGGVGGAVVRPVGRAAEWTQWMSPVRVIRTAITSGGCCPLVQPVSKVAGRGRWMGLVDKATKRCQWVMPVVWAGA